MNSDPVLQVVTDNDLRGEQVYIYIYTSYCSSGLLTTCKYLANLPKNCMHTYASSLLCRQLSSACVSAINFLVALTKSIKL